MRLHEWLYNLFTRSSGAPSFMRMSADGRKRLMDREGVRLMTYRDTVGVLTIGCGHTAAAGSPIPKIGMRITMAECEAILTRDLKQYEDAVRTAVNVPLTQGEFDALVSLCFNIGPVAFAASTVVRRLNAGDRSGAAQAIMLWSHPPEIIGRRKTEYQQFAQAAGIPPNQWIA